jgi:hypothetical protein
MSTAALTPRLGVSASEMGQRCGLQHGMGFILWLRDGYAERLEGYSYGESTSSVDLERADFEIRRE